MRITFNCLRFKHIVFCTFLSLGIHSIVIHWIELLSYCPLNCLSGLKIVCLSHRHNVGCTHGMLTCACVPVSHLPACQHGFIGPCGVYDESSKTCLPCAKVCFTGK